MNLKNNFTMSMEQDMKMMLDNIQTATEDQLEAYKKVGITPKHSGYMAQNIFIVDFKNAADFKKAIKIEKPALSYRVVDYSKKKRIVFHF